MKSTDEAIAALTNLGASTMKHMDCDEFFKQFMLIFDTAMSSINDALKEGLVSDIASSFFDATTMVRPDVAITNRVYFRFLKSDSDVLTNLNDVIALPEFKRQKAKFRFAICCGPTLLAFYNAKNHQTNSLELSRLGEYYSTFFEITGKDPILIEANVEASVKACQQITNLLDTLAKDNNIEQDHTHSINEFIRRVLFCLFAEATQIFESQQFTNAFANLVVNQGKDAKVFFTDLFTVLNTPENKRQELGQLMAKEILDFPYVNGGLFANQVFIPAFNTNTCKQLIECGKVKWNQISPAIFGAMFQNALDPALRHQQGAHYTSEENILKVIKPLFLDALTAEFEYIAALDESTPKAKDTKKEQLSLFHDKLSNLTFLDPACGCGNFLLIAYRELRRLENKVLELLLDENYLLLDEAIKVNINQFYGIEIEDWPAEIAHLSMWLMQHVMNQETGAKFGVSVATLPLKSSAVICQQNALTTDWNEVLPASKCSYIMGNPPFGGSVTTNEEQKRWLRDVYPPKHKLGRVDFVSGWFVKAASYMKSQPNIQAAFVATNSICQGQQVGILWGLLLSQGIRINFAYTSFKWSNAASKNAGVSCIIVGFGYRDVVDSAGDKRLFQVNKDQSITAITAKHISPYLKPVNSADDNSNTIVVKHSRPLSAPISMITGGMPIDGNNLIFADDEHNRIIADFPEAATFVKKFRGGKDIINDTYRWCLFLKEDDRNAWGEIPPIMQHVEACQRFREQSKKSGDAYKYRDRPWSFREQINPDHALAIPLVGSDGRYYVPMAFIEADTICSNLCLLIPNATPYHFGIVSSRIHMCWMRFTAGQLKTDGRYALQLTYNTFIWPQATPEQQETIGSLANKILDKHWVYQEDYNKTLADLYNQRTMPADLKQLHADLDIAVERLYRPEPFANDEERTSFMLRLYAEAVKAEQAKKKPTGSGTGKKRQSKAKAK
ncbi:MAG: N-6 DNA methylase [Candidatus Anaerobiospirillum pullicola]|uniref:site-specific DNA-methyltransferase (adenine-specific) n=1 Tax=Candidatus Anaerobiospirillum pullicola TaxID=2838451 RepID=A0A948WYN9_9GAMM|nr:N-6 DNA methylase [Candidatus Anaerobiospirillum pullicola]